MAKTYYFDMDGVLANFHEVKDGYKFSGSYKFIRNLKPFMNSVNLVKELIEKGNEVYISSLARNEYAKNAKVDWLAEYIPTMKKENIIILVGNAKKHENIFSEGVLVDDKLANVRAWCKAGMKAVYVEEKGVVNLDNEE